MPYDGLLNDLSRLKEENTNLLSELQKIQKEKLTANQLQTEIGKLETQISQLVKKEKDFDKILGQNISDNIEVKRKLNSILSPKILALNSNKALLKKVTETTDLLKIFDGEIKIDGLEIEPIETIDDVKEFLKTAKKQLGEKQKTLEFVKETTKKEQDQKEVEKQLTEKQQLLKN
ncbi:MAG: hypothetical protein IPO92_00070 [Saprospiraceae bacterium]|nr:hypothetical protein [Saprospiraceae bacterium]